MKKIFPVVNNTQENIFLFLRLLYQLVQFKNLVYLLVDLLFENFFFTIKSHILPQIRENQCLIQGIIAMT
ncbi:MAG: hypothetical protein K5660_09505, partial [Paludibacteraceae bacterium]|nr:hypothetical protein [Paludibacteraceae bacterium]